MKAIENWYIRFYLLVYALYAYFNKGIAYSFLAEALLGIGLILLLTRIRTLEIPKHRLVFLLLFLLGVNFVYVIRAIASGYSVVDSVRDSFMFNYAIFIGILFSFKEQKTRLETGLIYIYTWFPLVETILFLILAYIPNADQFSLFGSISLLHYKYGDLAVHLFISLVLMLTGRIQLPKRFFIGNLILISYLFLVLSSYSRAGMVCFGTGALLFIILMEKGKLKDNLIQYLRIAPLILLIALPIYQSTKVEENFQGRKVGIEQIAENVTSITKTEKGSTQANNNVWRLVWWGKIIDYTILGPYFFQGKGLGINLAEDDQITMSEEGDLRSPHSFHLNVLGRFGLPLFLVWLYWIYRHKGFFKEKFNIHTHMILCICIVFLLNSSFDVFLEGPMGAFPFWTWVGLLYVNKFFKTDV